MATFGTGCKYPGLETADLSGPSPDTYVLSKQWIYAYEHDETAPETGLFNADDLEMKAPAQIVELVAQIVEQGEAHWPVKFYPPFTFAELDLAHDLFLANPDLDLAPKFAKALGAAWYAAKPKKAKKGKKA